MRPSASLSVIVAFAAALARPCAAQTLVPSVDELRRELAVGDQVTIVGTDGTPIVGRLMRVGVDDLDIRRGNAVRNLRDVTLPFNTIRSLDRPTDSVRNGIAIGAGVGAAIGAAFFLYALAVDRNEIDEWAPAYLGATAVSTAIGATIGLSVDLARSKPHIRFNRSSTAGRPAGTWP